MTQRIVTWNTAKTADGFEYHVYSFGHELPTITLKRGTVRTRAIAARLAKQWTLYHKRIAA
jgi:hypothetical protein